MKVFFAGVALLFGCSLQARAQTFQTFDVPGSIPGNTLANGINNNGEISGYFADLSGWHGYLLSKEGTLTSFDVPGAVGSTYAFGLNDRDQVVGRCITSAGQQLGFERDPNGDINLFSVPGADITQAMAINNRRQIVGTYHDANGYHGFLRGVDGTFTSFDGPGATYTTARGISDNGQIVGYFFDNNGWRGFLVDRNGTMTTIDVNPVGSSSFETRLTGINNQGQIVGYTAGGTFPTYVGFVRSKEGQITILEVPTATGPEGTQAFGINNPGTVVGYFTDPTGSHGFLAD